MADTLKTIILSLLAVIMPVICSCGTSEPDSTSEVKPVAESVPAAADSVSVEADIGADRALQQWENCVIRSCFEKPSMFSILHYIRSNVCRPELLTILIERFLSDTKNGVLPLSRADMYRIVSGVPFEVRTPSEPAAGISYFTDSSVVLIFAREVYKGEIYPDALWHNPLQDWCSLLTGAAPQVSFERTSYSFEATYGTPVPVTFFTDTGAVSDRIRKVQWTAQLYGSQSAFTIDQSVISLQKMMGMVISSAPVSTDGVSVSRQSWCSWSIDINNDSVADLRTVTSGDTLNDKGRFDLFAQVNINGQWVTTDYKIGCETQTHDDYNGIRHSYVHQE